MASLNTQHSVYDRKATPAAHVTALSALNEHGLIIVNFPSCHTSTVLPVITGQTQSLLSSRACSGDGKGIGPWTALRKCLSVQLENNAALLFTILLFSLMRCCLFIRFHHTPGEPGRLCYYQGQALKCFHISHKLFFFFLFPFQLPEVVFWSPLGTSVTDGNPIRIKSPNRIKVSECKRHE